jgi:replicative DNA helicase
MARAAAKSGFSVGIFSLEMSKEQLVDRLIAAEAGISLWKLRTGKLSGEEEFSRIREAMARLSEMPIYIDDTPSASTLHMRAMARRLQAEKGLDLLVIDYLQLVQPTSSSDSMVQQVTEISRSLKALAKELNIPVLALSQLSRAVEHRPDQRPRLSDLRESGSLEQDSDVVLFIYREDKVRPNTPRQNIADIIIAKHRNGPIGKVELYFNEDLVSFTEIETAYEEEITGEEVI